MEEIPCTVHQCLWRVELSQRIRSRSISVEQIDTSMLRTSQSTLLERSSSIRHSLPSVLAGYPNSQTLTRGSSGRSSCSELSLWRRPPSPVDISPRTSLIRQMTLAQEVQPYPALLPIRQQELLRHGSRRHSLSSPYRITSIPLSTRPEGCGCTLLDGLCWLLIPKSVQGLPLSALSLSTLTGTSPSLSPHSRVSPVITRDLLPVLNHSMDDPTMMDYGIEIQPEEMIPDQ